MKELKKTLSRQGYPAKLIDTSIKEAKKLPKNQLRQQKVAEETTQILAFVSTYNPRNPDTIRIIKELYLYLMQAPNEKSTSTSEPDQQQAAIFQPETYLNESKVQLSNSNCKRKFYKNKTLQQRQMWHL